MKRQITVGERRQARLALGAEAISFSCLRLDWSRRQSGSGAYPSTMPPDQKGQGMASMLTALGKTTGDRGFSRAKERRGPVRWLLLAS
jgi:hypothetical protein